MKIYDFIKKKRLEFLKAKLNLLKSTYSEKDLQQLKDMIWDIEEENKFKILGDQECLNKEFIEYETINGSIIFDDVYTYNINKNTINKLVVNYEKFMERNKF